MSLLVALGLQAPKRGLPAAPAARPDAATMAAGSGGGAGDVAEAAPPALGAAPDPALQAAGGGGAAAAPNPGAAAFATARAAVQALADALNAHPQKARIATQIAAAQAKLAKLAEADTHAATPDWPTANKALGAARTICVAAKKIADDWVIYLRERTDVIALAMSFASADFNPWGKFNPKLAAADAFAAASPPDFAKARAAIKKIKDEYKPWSTDLVKSVKTKLAAVEKASAGVKDFAKAELAEGKTYLANAEAALSAGEWSQVWQNAAAGLRVLGPLERTAGRRGAFDTQRAKTVAAIAKVRAVPAMKTAADALDKKLAEADALAAHDTQQFERAIAALNATAAQAAAWAAVSATVASHAKERAAADKELAALDAHAAVAKIKAQLDAARGLLAQAAVQAALSAAATEPAGPWTATLTTVQRARADLAAAKKLADSLSAASGAEAAAAKPGDLKGMKAALDKLRADGTAASKAAGAAEADAEFKTFTAQVAAAAAAVTANDGATAGKALTAAAAALARAKAIQSDHGQFAAGVGAMDKELAALNKSPRAAAITARIDPIANALADAKAKDKAHAGAEAMAALRLARDLLPDARAADAARKVFDDRAAALDKRIAKVADAAEKATLAGLAAAAKPKADALDFAGAAKDHDAVEVRFDKVELEAKMAANPNDPKIAKMAAGMVKKGGATTVDAMIQNIPNGGEPKLLNALAEGRYGVKFTNTAPLPAQPPSAANPAGVPAGDPVRAMKEVCKMFATIPQDIVKSPSVKGVSYDDAIGSAGGAFSYDTAKISMLGRPGIPQQFGAAQTNTSPITGATVAQLPPDADIEEACKPLDATAVEYLGFAAAHEVGHAVDDAQGFMARHGSGEKYGGWTMYGASVQPIADAIAGDARFAAYCKTAAQKQYVLDRLLNKPTAPPPTAPATPEDAARIEFLKWIRMATSADVFRRQGDCDYLKIGDHVYHEAYGRQWVRYLAAARKRALTGYQFRAPGEWFAELYAGFRSGKLKDTHPSMEWLKKL